MIFGSDNRLASTCIKPLSETMLTFWQFFHSRKCIWKMHFKKGSHYASVSVSWVHLHHGEHSSSEINYHTCTVFFITYAAQFICKWLSHPWNIAIYFPDRYEQWACYSQLNIYRDSVLIYNLMIWYFLFCICSHSGMEITKITPHLPVSSRVLGCEENFYF